MSYCRRQEEQRMSKAACLKSVMELRSLKYVTNFGKYLSIEIISLAENCSNFHHKSHRKHMLACPTKMTAKTTANQ